MSRVGSKAMADSGQHNAAERRRQGLRRTAARAGMVARLALKAIRIARRLLWQSAEILLALVIIFEEWGWKPLAALAARLARFKPIAAAEAVIVQLPPYPALAVFALPSILLLPLKLVALWLIANGHLVWASILFVGAKVAGTAVLARIFQLTQPALMRLAWFAWLYNTLMPWKEALVERLRASRAWRVGRVVKARLKHAAEAAWAESRPVLAPAIERVRERVAALLGLR